MEFPEYSYFFLFPPFLQGLLTLYISARLGNLPCRFLNRNNIIQNTQKTEGVGFAVYPKYVDISGPTQVQHEDSITHLESINHGGYIRW